MAKEMLELAALVLSSFILLADCQGGMDRLCFTDPQVSQYCAGMETYKYFFDDITGQCVYRLGCAFSGFPTMTQCKKECVCRQPISEGTQVGGPNCEQEIMRWMAVGEVCVQKPYSGCGGNGNNFRTQGECQSACNPRELESMMGFDLPSFNEMPFALPPGSFGSGMAHPGVPVSGGNGPPRRPNNAPGMGQMKGPPRKGGARNQRRPPPPNNNRPPPPKGNRPTPPNGNMPPPRNGNRPPPPPQNRWGPPNPNRQPNGPPNGRWQPPPPNGNRPPPPHGAQNQRQRGPPPPQRQGPPPPWARNGPPSRGNPAGPNGPNANPNFPPQRQPNAPPQRQPNYPPPQQNSRPNFPPPQNNPQQQQWGQINQVPPQPKPQSNIPPQKQVPITQDSSTQVPPGTSPLPDYPSSTSGWNDPFSWMVY
uniref:Basic salivary proline-rich protein 1-like n=1 Tax=Crassostrea virginica TaxID=6565 RepID=A0A8B8E0B3_CRAVI|nr:basic salivary proline-rich protein 1-like [Crassostrea virginica]